MRVTIDRKFVLKSESIATGSSSSTDDCKTIATTDGMYVTDEATDKYTHVPVIAEGGTNAQSRICICQVITIIYVQILLAVLVAMIKI